MSSSSSKPSKQNPFPGLRPFTQDEDYLFFGREEQTLELLQRLGSNRFVAVVGTSGSGKSSLVRCGLLSELLGGRMLDAGSAWEIAVTHPGGNPLALLTDALLDADLYDREQEHARENLLATLSRSHFGLVEAIKQSDIGEGTNFLLVVDQFEEIFRFQDAGQRQQEVANEFVSLLLEAVAQKDVPIYVVLTMRSDFIGECGQFEGLAEMVNRGEFLIPRLTREQYKRVIEGPIKVAGGKIAPRLLQRLLNDLGQQADQLPCLQHALMRTWNVWAERGDADELDLDDYQRVGKMSQALSLHADEIYESLDSDRQRELCRGIFQALTVEESNNRGIRRPQRLGRLCQILEVSADELRPIIDAYRHSGVTFLMPSPDVELTDQTIIDISHESLMRVWTRLRYWVEEESQAVGIYRRLAESATLHAEGKAGLYRDPELGIALAWREEKHPNQAWAERYRAGFEQAMEFLEQSHQAGLADEQAHEVARQRELEQARKLAEAERCRAELEQCAARRLRGLAVVMAVVAVFAVGASIVAFQSWRDADAARQTAQKSEQAARSSADDAKREATRATAEEERATVARRDAEESLTAARTAIDEFLVQVSDSKLLSTPGLQPLRADLLSSASKFYSEFLTKNPDDLRLQAGLADAFFRVGFVNGEMGRYDEAIPSLEKSIKLQEAALKARPTDSDLRHRLAKAWYECSASQLRRHDVPAADESARHAARLWETLSREFPENIDYRKSLARACNILGNTSGQRADFERGYLAYQRSMQIRLELLEHHPQDVEVLHGLAESFHNIALLVSDVEQRLNLSERSLEYGATAHRLSPLNVEYAVDHALSHLSKGRNLSLLNRKPQVLESWRKGVEHCLKFIRANPSVPAIREQLNLLLSHVRYYSFDAALADEYANIFRAVRSTFAELPRQTAEDHFEWAQVQSDCAAQLFRARKTFQNKTLTPKEDADIAVWRAGSLAALHEALALGLKDIGRVKQDALLADVRTQPQFKDVLTKVTAIENGTATVATNAEPMPEITPQDRAVQFVQDRATGFMAYGVAETWLTQEERASKSFDDAFALRQSLADAAPDNIPRLVSVIEVREARTRLLRSGGQLKQARDEYSQMVEQLEQALARNLSDADAMRAAKTLADVERDYADFLEQSGLWDEATPHTLNALRHSLRHRDLLRKLDPSAMPESEKVYEEILSPMLTLLEPSGTPYPEACQPVLTKFQGATFSEQAARVARLAALVPNAVPDLNPILVKSDNAQHAWHAYTRGLVRYRLGQFEEAIQIIQKAQKEKAIVSMGVEDFVVAMAQFQLGQKEQALKLLAATNAKSPRAMVEWAHSPHNMLDVDWLILRREANQLIHGSPNAPDDRGRRGQAYAQLNEYEKAETELSAFLIEHPDDLRLHWIHAQALWSLDRKDEAAQTLDRARQLLDEKGNASIGDVDLWQLAAESYRHCDRRDKFIAALRQARAGQVLKVMQAPLNWPTRRAFLKLNEELANALRTAGRDAEATIVTAERDGLLAGMQLRPVLASISDSFAETRPREQLLSASLVALDQLLKPELSLSSGSDSVSRTLRARLLQQRATLRGEAGQNNESTQDLSAARKEYEQLLSGDVHNTELAKGLSEVLLELTQPEWKALKPVAMQSAGGATLTALPDLSILASGVNSIKDTYTIKLTDLPPSFHGLRLEALPHESLSNRGPGRSSNGNFVLTGIQATLQPSDRGKAAQELSIAKGIASFEQAERIDDPNSFTLAKALDPGSDTDGWAVYPELGRPHTAVFAWPQTVAGGPGSELTVTLKFDRGFETYGIGHFRFSVVKDSTALTQDARRFAATRFADPWARLGGAYAAIGDQPQAAANLLKALELTTDRDKHVALNQQIGGAIAADSELLAEFLKRDHGQALLMAELANRLAERGDSAAALNLRTKARTLLEEKLAKEPNDAVMQTALADVLMKSAETKWMVLSPTEMKSEPGTPLKQLADGSILAGGTNPAHDDYKITAKVGSQPVAAIRIEALVDESLPNKGPGRSVSGGFVMDYFELLAALATKSDQSNRVDFSRVEADYFFAEQPPELQNRKWHISGGEGKPHVMIGQLATPIANPEGTFLTFHMLFNHGPDWPKLNLGRFRLSVATDAAEVVREQQRWAAAKLTDPLAKLGAAYALSDDATKAVDHFVAALERTTDPAKQPELAKQMAPFIVSHDRLLTDFSRRNHEQPLLMLEVTRLLDEQGRNEVAAELRAKARMLLEAKLASEPEKTDIQSSLAELLLHASDLKWTVLPPTEMTSQGGATLTKLEDNSILASGINPPTDRYSITVALPETTTLQSIRLEALPHDSLPARGPGRGIGGLFAMTKWDVTAMPLNGSTPRSLAFQGGTADFEFARYPVTPNGQWNISGAKTGQQHAAVWTLPEAVTLDAGTKLHFQMEFNKSTNYTDQNLGRFRLSASTDPAAFPREQQRFTAMKLTDPQAKLAAAYFLSGDSERVATLLAKSPTQAQLVINSWISSGASLDGLLDLLKDRASSVYAAVLPDAARAAAEQGTLDLSRSLYARLTALQPENALWKERAAQLQPGTLAVWNFDSTPGNWGSPLRCELSVKAGALTTRQTATDCSLSTPIDAPAGGKTFALRYRAKQNFTLQIYWADTVSLAFSDTRMQAYPIPASADNWREIVLPFASQSPISSLRFDPETGIGNSLEVDSIILRQVERNEYQKLANELLIEPELARLNKAIDADPKSAARRVERGNLFLRLGRWREAADDFEQDRALNPTSRFVWFRAANCLLLAGDEAGYRNVCQGMLAQFPTTIDSQVSDSVIKTCLLRSGTIELSELPIQLLRTALDDPKQAGFHNWFLACSALYSYREGKFDEAIAWTKRNPNPGYTSGALTLVVRAMAEHQIGQHEQARKTLAEAEALIPAELRTLGTPGDNTPLPIPAASIATDWLTAELLRREVSKLINGNPTPSTN